MVTAASLPDPALCILLNQDQEVGYRFDEPDELTHAHAATIHRSQGGGHLVWSSLVTSAWPSLQRTPIHYPGALGRARSQPTRLHRLERGR